MPLLTLDSVSTAFGHLPLLAGASLQVEPGERVAIIGRNGTGKSTLLRILNGELAPDAGTVWRAPGLTSSRLDQDVPLVSDRTVFDVVADGLGALSDLVSRYHHAAVDVAADPSPGRLEALGRLQQALEERDGWTLEQRVELVLAKLSLPADAVVNTLSGGWRRRVMLGRALVAQPALLLLDEPTNHLDIDAIAWLEELLLSYGGAVVFVTHDRAFLRRLATRVVDLDRGRLTSWPGDYDTFVEKKDAWLTHEALQHEQFDRRLAEEEAWLRQGIRARRTRNEGRVKALLAMREARTARRDVAGRVRLAIDAADRSGHVVFEVEHASVAFGERRVVDDVSLTVARGDRIGLVGPNGAGKTTFLRLLVGDRPPDSGAVHRGTNVEIAYFDQQREQLDPDRTVVDTVADGNDTVTVGGIARHVHGYLRDFLFPPERAQAPVRALSGGERNRLLLARLFTRPANVLVLDEPTNDLDLETLELLEAQLVAFAGTILLVSHDRTFLDHVVTSLLVFDGSGRVEEHVGGWEDWQRYQRERAAAAATTAPGAGRAATGAEGTRAAGEAAAGSSPAGRSRRGPRPDRLTFKEQRELEALPGVIEALEAEQRDLEARLGSPEFYREAPDVIRAAAERQTALQRELEDAYSRWDALETRATAR
ncbi:MAG: ATP-binding cassette domain-containing protein [Vicinamibacterales bacterium]